MIGEHHRPPSHPQHIADALPTKGAVLVRRTHLTISSIGLAALLTLTACGSDEKSTPTTKAASTVTTIAPEDIIVTDEVVEAGLKKLPGTIDSAIAAIGTPDAKAKLDANQAEWFSFEGTIREKDTTLYLAIEDQLTPLQRDIEDGKSAEATTTAAALDVLFTQYLTTYPVS